MLVDERLDTILGGAITVAPYAPTHRFPGTYLNDNHQGFAEAPLDGVKIIHRVRGSLRREDAAKIYELAYFSNGDVADLGTNWGLSAFIAGTALDDAGGVGAMRQALGAVDPSSVISDYRRSQECGINLVANPVMLRRPSW
jgi:hypothetical protein